MQISNCKAILSSWLTKQYDLSEQQYFIHYHDFWKSGSFWKMSLHTCASIHLTCMSFPHASGRIYKGLTSGLWTQKHQANESISYYSSLRTKSECGMKCQATSDCDGFIWNHHHMCEVLSNVNFCPVLHQTEVYYSYRIKQDEANGGKSNIHFIITYSYNVFEYVSFATHKITFQAGCKHAKIHIMTFI